MAAPSAIELLAALLETNRAIASLLNDFCSELRGLRADLRSCQLNENSRHTRAPSRAPLLAAIAASVTDRVFTARELLEHAAIDPALAAALAVAQITTARSLGKALRALERGDFKKLHGSDGGCRLERLAVERDGIVWRVWQG